MVSREMRQANEPTDPRPNLENTGCLNLNRISVGGTKQTARETRAGYSSGLGACVLCLAGRAVFLVRSRSDTLRGDAPLRPRGVYGLVNIAPRMVAIWGPASGAYERCMGGAIHRCDLRKRGSHSRARRGTCVVQILRRGSIRMPAVADAQDVPSVHLGDGLPADSPSRCLGQSSAPGDELRLCRLHTRGWGAWWGAGRAIQRGCARWQHAAMMRTESPARHVGTHLARVLCVALSRGDGRRA